MVKEQKKDFSLEALRNGDRVEYARMVDAYYEMIYKLAFRMLDNAQDAEDILQETFIKAYKHLKNFDGRSSLSTWLYRIATNEALMLIRRRKPEALSISEPSDLETEDQQPFEIIDWRFLPEETFLSDELKDHLDRAVSKLPLTLRMVFILRDMQGLSTRETSEALEISEMAVKTRLSRARLRLREELSSYFSEQLMDVKGKSA